MTLSVRPIELKAAVRFIEQHHRHLPKERAHRFSVACYDGERLCGVAVCGRPKAAAYDPIEVVEVTRLCTDGTPNACSKLLGAAARAAREIGYRRIQTYTLESEPGTSLRAAGWIEEASGVGGGDWNNGHSAGLLYPIRKPADNKKKRRWARTLNERAEP